MEYSCKSSLEADEPGNGQLKVSAGINWELMGNHCFKCPTRYSLDVVRILY